MVEDLHFMTTCDIKYLAVFLTECSDSKKSTNLAMTLTKNEGATILSAWTSVVASLEAYARYADNLAKQIKLGNHELNKILSSAEKELKALHESEESRWKYLCDAAKGETKATVRHKKCVADLEKAKARLSLLEDEGVSESVDETAAADALNSSQRPSFMPQSTKMTPSMNKAMGKMFSILPGGGEDVMEKVLNPEQRLAIAKRNLDDVAAKEAKGTESFEVARSVKQQAVVSYVTEAEVAEFKFKSDERHAWNEMQKSLEYLVKAISVFRESYHRNVMSSIESINKCRETATLDDVAQWTANVEKRVKDDRVRHAAKINDKSNSFEVGFSLGLQLEDSTDVKELVTLVITDENGSTTNGVSSIFSFVI